MYSYRLDTYLDIIVARGRRKKKSNKYTYQKRDEDIPNKKTKQNIISRTHIQYVVHAFIKSMRG